LFSDQASLTVMLPSLLNNLVKCSTPLIMSRVIFIIKNRFAKNWRRCRKPEFGAVMVRGRAGGTGQQFNLGEAVLTRCALRLSAGVAGYAHVLGRDVRHAELAALCDALLQTSDHCDTIQRDIIAPLAAAHAARREERSRRTNATRVEFLAMARGVSLTSKAAYQD
jgi:alpha-D-ribose 1-methylphosphonate 5-triphosphate synthase subunit PhnG